MIFLVLSECEDVDVFLSIFREGVKSDETLPGHFWSEIVSANLFLFSGKVLAPSYIFF